MAEPKIDNIQQVMLARAFPTITLWNRLEGRPRTDDFDRALKAEIRDPLWMLTKQWQMGEFQGDDAGTPVFAKVHMGTSRLDTFQPGDQTARPFDYEIPFEGQVEQRPIPFASEGQYVSLDIRLLMGRHWLKLLRSVGDFRDDFIGLYQVDVPDPTLKTDAGLCAHSETWQHVSAVASRAMDGYKLYKYLTDSDLNHAYDDTSIQPADHAAVDLLAEKFVAWFVGLFYQPDTPENHAWKPSYLEYQFAVSAPDESGFPVLKAEEYFHGRLDWYNLDVDAQRTTLGDVPPPDGPGDLPHPTQSFIPTPLVFEGMPHTRWWTLEDSRTNFGDVNPGTKDLSKLMLIEFGLIYANDWFLFPLTLPIGTITRLKGLAVTNVFGERTWIEPAGRGRDEAWQRWNMYTMSVYGDEDVRADMRFVLLPTVPKIQESAPLEDVMLIRDEMANMVWGIETRVPMADGRSRSGYETAIDLHRFHERRISAAPAPPPPPAAAPVRYEVMSNNVPGNWIPFVPVHVPDSNRDIQLQRAALPRIIPNDPEPPEKIRPRTALLGEGRADDEAYILHEEEVPRAGVRVMQTYQRTRWHNGKVLVWLGVRKQTGRGEGSSNLRFDYLGLTRQSG